MDLDEFRTILGNSGVGIWGFIETAIKVASLDYKDEFRAHRDGIVAKLYANCPNCDLDARVRVRASSGNGFVGNNAVVETVFGGEEEEEERHNKGHSPYNPVSILGGKGGVGVEDEDEDEDEGYNKGHSPYNPVSIGGVEVEEEEEGHNKGHSPYTPVSIGGDDVEVEVEEDEDHEEGERVRKMEDQRFDDENDEEDEYDEERRIIAIKEQLEDPNQSEESLVDLLQTLADMDITFRALKDTDIGKHVNRLRKHRSNDVKRLVKLLVRTWKDLVDDWVRSNGAVEGAVEGQSSNLIADGDSPQQNFPKNQQNSHRNQVPDFGYSPNPHNGSFPHATPPGRNPPVKPTKTTASVASSAPQPNKQKQIVVDPERLASARRRLQENYQEAQNAKKQRTIQVMEINELPKGKSKNSSFGRKGGFQRR